MREVERSSKPDACAREIGASFNIFGGFKDAIAGKPCSYKSGVNPVGAKLARDLVRSASPRISLVVCAAN